MRLSSVTRTAASRSASSTGLVFSPSPEAAISSPSCSHVSPVTSRRTATLHSASLTVFAISFF
jgi:hypothetical protein